MGTGKPNAGGIDGAPGIGLGRGVEGGIDTVGIAGRVGMLMLDGGLVAEVDVGSSDGSGSGASSHSDSSQLEEVIGAGVSIVLPGVLVVVDVLDDAVVLLNSDRLLDIADELLDNSEVSVVVTELVEIDVVPVTPELLDSTPCPSTTGGGGGGPLTGAACTAMACSVRKRQKAQRNECVKE